MKDLKEKLNEALSIKESFGKDIQIPRTEHCIVFVDEPSDTVSVYGFKNIDELCQATFTDVENWYDLEDHLKRGEVCYMDARGNVSWNKQKTYDNMIIVLK